MDSPQRRSIVLALPIAWLLVMVGLFIAALQNRDTDDYAGIIPTLVALQLPAHLALVRAPYDRVLGLGRSLALALPAAVALAGGAFFVAGELGVAIWSPRPFEFRPLFLAMGAGIVALIVAVAVFTRVALRRLHPSGARRVLGAVAIAGAAGTLAMVFDADARAAPGAWLMIAAPLAWPLPLWPTVRRPRTIPEARVR